MSKIVMANMKMNMTLEEVISYISEVKKMKDVVVFPSSIYVPYFIKEGIITGVQNIYYKECGAYTGEITGIQVKSMGAKYVLVGHSERRIHFKESNTDTNLKIRCALQNNLNVVFCIGETLQERESGKTGDVLKKQLVEGFRDLKSEEIKNIIIAYEPVWSIGTGIVPKKEEIIDTVSLIKTVVTNFFKDEAVRVLYGGSVNDKNILELSTIEVVDGYLIGGASLDISKLKYIMEVAVK